MKLGKYGLKHAGIARFAASLFDAGCDYGRGFFQPPERWPAAQQALALLLSLGAVWWGGARLGAAVDVSGNEARQHALALLEQSVLDAQRQAGNLPALRERAAALGAGDSPEPVPGNGALLRIISRAVDAGGVSLALYEPTRLKRAAVKTATHAADSGGPEPLAEIAVHLKAAGTYAHILRFAQALSALPQAVIVTQAKVLGNGQETMDALVRVIGEPTQNERLSKAYDLVSGSLRGATDTDDPFDPDSSRGRSSGIDTALAGKVAPQRFAGRFQLGERRALLLRNAEGWQLVPLAQHSPMPEIAMHSAAVSAMGPRAAPQAAPSVRGRP